MLQAGVRQTQKVSSNCLFGSLGINLCVEVAWSELPHFSSDSTPCTCSCQLAAFALIYKFAVVSRRKFCRLRSFSVVSWVCLGLLYSLSCFPANFAKMPARKKWTWETSSFLQLGPDTPAFAAVHPDKPAVEIARTLLADIISNSTLSEHEPGTLPKQVVAALEDIRALPAPEASLRHKVLAPS